MTLKAAAEKTSPAAGAASGDFGDPLRYDIPLPLKATFHPMGYAVSLSTNSQAVMDAAREVWELWEPRDGSTPIEVRFAVRGESAVRPIPAPLPFGQGHLISVVHSPENFAVADVERGFIFGWVTADTARDSAYFRYHFLESMVYLTLTCLHFVPVHSAFVALHGWGILLCGDSGCGKTSLAYALARRGWTYLSDDAAYVVRGADPLCAIGRPHHIRFRSSAVQLFPELARHPLVLRPNGKVDLELPTADLEFASTASTVKPAMIVFLDRKPGIRTPCLSAYSKTVAREKLERVVCFGPDRIRAEQVAAIAEVVKLPVFSLEYSDFEGADACLRKAIV